VLFRLGTRSDNADLNPLDHVTVTVAANIRMTTGQKFEIVTLQR